VTTNPYADTPDIKQLLAELAVLPRRHLLLRAVIADMEHLADPDLPEDNYLNAALELADYDRQHCTWAPGPGPDSNTWTGDDGALEYVRAQWRAAQQTAS
jgi:hypothetical protein